MAKSDSTNFPRARHIVLPAIRKISSWREYDTLDEWTWNSFRLSVPSALNWLRDAAAVRRDPGLRLLHDRVSGILRRSRTWPGYDYGHGYLYQSSPRLAFSGRRDTRARIEAMPFQKYMTGRDVLDIGCNTGFISLEFARWAKHVTGFDVNPHLVEIAQVCAEYLSVRNTHFFSNTFGSVCFHRDFDVVVSLSNHFTYDGLMATSFDEYVCRCASFLRSGGYFIFESHTPKFERRHGRLDDELQQLRAHFKEEYFETARSGRRLDQKRLLFIGRTR